MEDWQIEVLKTKVSQGNVYWRNPDGVCLKVCGIKMNWVEFPDEPELTEPAAMLPDGKVAALYACNPLDFVTMEPVSYQ